jgi:lysophospholipase L1-like esterase
VTRTSAVSNFAVAALSAAVALLIAEGIARLAGVGPRFGQLIYVRGVPTRTVDGVPLWDDADPRCDEADVERAARDRSAFTILGLGDSIMFGVSQTKDATYLEQARREIAQRSKRRVEILNLAVPGFNTMQENAVYREIEPRFTPKLVLVHYWTDDVHQYRVVGGYVVDLGNVSEEDGRLVVRAIPLPPRLGDFLLVHSRLYDLLTQVVIALRREDIADDWSRVAAPLKEIQERAQRSGARLVVLASPLLDGPLPRPNSDLERLREFGAANGIEVVDLSTWLDGHRSEDVALDMCHFNAVGHRLIGERLAEYLLAHDLKQ